MLMIQEQPVICLLEKILQGAQNHSDISCVVLPATNIQQREVSYQGVGIQLRFSK